MFVSTLPAPRPLSARQPAATASRRRGSVALLAGGLATVAVAGALLAHPRHSERAAAPIETLAPHAITVGGPGDVSVVTQVYEPGKATGWHSHAGIHAVAVLSGALTVYDDLCRPQIVVPGQPYVGGQDLHLARNETAAPVEMVVTYVSPAAPANSTRPASAPACWAATNG